MNGLRGRVPVFKEIPSIGPHEYRTWYFQSSCQLVSRDYNHVTGNRMNMYKTTVYIIYRSRIIL